MKACITKKERERENEDDGVVVVDDGSGNPLDGVTTAASSCKNSSSIGTNSIRIRGDTGVRLDTTDATGEPDDGVMERGDGTMLVEENPVVVR